jgi:peptide/nickel transport system permease protein
VAQFLLRRLFYFIPVIFLVTVVVFAITMLLPGDPALAFLGEGGIRDKIAYEAMRQELGLDRSLPVQYVHWLGKALHGNLGRSVRTHEAVTDALVARLPVTIELAAVSLVIALTIAVPVGIVSATRPNSPVDTAATVVAVSGVALPEFFVGILLIYVFAVGLRVLPPSGYVPLSAGLWPNLRSILLPALSLGMTLNAVTMRQVRASLIEVMREEYVTVARAKGLPESSVIRVHALKNALIPVITVIGLQVGRLFGGTVVVETIFAFPGMGRLAADSIFFRDFPALQGVVLVMALAVLTCNLLTDVLYAYVDPRIRYA